MHNQVAAGDFSYVEQMRAAQAQAQVRGQLSAVVCAGAGGQSGGADGAMESRVLAANCAIQHVRRLLHPAPPAPQAQQAAAASQRLANGEPGADEDSSSDEEGSEDEDGEAMDAEVRWWAAPTPLA